MKKYSEREKNRTKDALHKVSKFIADNFKGYGVIMEDLKLLRRTVNKKVKKLNRYNHKIQKVSINNDFLKFRLNSFPFRMIQFYIQYKSLFNGSSVFFVNPRDTSKICFRCGGTINSSKFCPNCALDRDINACLNLLKMWGLPPPESLSNAKMTLPLTIKNEDKAGDLSRKGIVGVKLLYKLFKLGENILIGENMAEVKELMFAGLELTGAPKFDEIEKMAASLSEEREKSLESLRKVIGI